MDLKNENGVDVQSNGNSKEAVNNTAKAQNVTKVTGSASKAGAGAKSEKEEALQPEPTKGPQPAKQEVKEGKTVKLAPNLESTLKLVDELHRRSIQRLNLISRIGQLEAFEVSLTTENDELEENPYQGCKLIIEDDKGRRFVTTTPGLIRMVAQFIFNACHEKLADIEAHIVLPVA